MNAKRIQEAKYLSWKLYNTVNKLFECISFYVLFDQIIFSQDYDIIIKISDHLTMIWFRMIHPKVDILITILLQPVHMFE